jgi:hypothetical protein
MMADGGEECQPKGPIDLLVLYSFVAQLVPQARLTRRLASIARAMAA